MIKKIIGIIVFVAGVALLCTSYYIKDQVEEGKGQIKSAQKKVNTANKLFSLTPETKQLGQGATNSAQKQIDAGKQQVGYYEDLAGKLQIGGIVLMVVGVGIIFIGGKKKK
jgi:hypothetical protein